MRRPCVVRSDGDPQLDAGTRLHNEKRIGIKGASITCRLRLVEGLRQVAMVKRMKVAVPEHQGRIAPVFDTCRHVLVFLQDVHADRVTSDEDWSAVSQQTRVARLMDLQVDVLLCGAISCWLEDQIVLQGIRLVAWVAGDLAQVLTALREGTIMDPEFAMPGTLACRKHRQMRRAGGAPNKRSPCPGPKEKGPCRD